MALILSMGKPFTLTPASGNIMFRTDTFQLPHTFSNGSAYEFLINVEGLTSLTITNTHNCYIYGLKADGTFEYIDYKTGGTTATIDVTDYSLIFTNQFTSSNFSTEVSGS